MLLKFFLKLRFYTEISIKEAFFSELSYNIPEPTKKLHLKKSYFPAEKIAFVQTQF